ncbi:NAD(P)-binding oxidoreductase [Streptomyces griseorubiginosus]|uniref:NAD(P)-dependent oxidoreductase n=1 Tax=Streptomyces griseorubiginosus TaxID=67304 RepID=UPI0033A380B1
MRIAVVGATGRTGRELVRQALADGHEVVAYVRRPEAVTPIPGLTVVGGQLDDEAALTDALEGCDAVTVALGNPITKASAPLMQIAMPTVIAAAKNAGVRRVVVLSALGVGATLANTRYPYRFGCRTFLVGAFRDHLAGESLLEDTSLDWTTIHPGPLFDGPRTPHPTIVDAASRRRMPRAPRTMRADVAAAMLDMLTDPATFGRQMLITSVQQ